MSVPGIGPIISSAMVDAIGTGDAFTKGRDFAAWLGLVPKQISTGDRTIPRQDIQARQSLPACLVRPGGMGCADQAQQLAAPRLKPWLEAADKRLHHNVLAIALANKLARIAWSVLAHGRTFEASKI
jgi:transposase